MLVDAGGAGRGPSPSLRRLRDRRRPGRHHPGAPAGGAGLRRRPHGGRRARPRARIPGALRRRGRRPRLLSARGRRGCGCSAAPRCTGAAAATRSRRATSCPLLRAPERLADPQARPRPLRAGSRPHPRPRRARGVRPARSPRPGALPPHPGLPLQPPDPFRRQVPGRDRGEREDHLRGQRQPRRHAARRRPRHDDRGALPLLRAPRTPASPSGRGSSRSAAAASRTRGLLLAANSQLPAGIGNGNDLVGTHRQQAERFVQTSRRQSLPHTGFRNRQASGRRACRGAGCAGSAAAGGG